MAVNIKVLKKNILNEAYKQLLDQYPSFAPFITKYSIDEISPEGDYATGAFSLIINKVPLTIPIVFRNGNVTCTDYIGYDQTGKYFMLTKTLYNKIVNNVSIVLGTVIDKKENSKTPNPIDSGVFGSLFATPTTMSPKIAARLTDLHSKVTPNSVIRTITKVASEESFTNPNYNGDSMIADMAFQDRNFANSLLKIASQNRYSEFVLSHVVDIEGLKKQAENSKLEKIASEYLTKVAVYTNMDEVSHLPKSVQQEARYGLAVDGFFIKNEYLLDKEASVVEITPKTLLNKNNLDKLQILRSNKPSIYTVFTKDFEPRTVINLGYFGAVFDLGIDELVDIYANESNNSETVGIPKDHAGLSDVSLLHHFSQTSKKLKQIDLSLCTDYDTKILLIATNQEITSYRIRNCYKQGDSIIAVPLGGERKKIVITNSVLRPITKEGVMYVPYNNAFTIKLINGRKKRDIYLTENELNSPVLQKTASYSYGRDGYFNINGSKLREKQFIVKLAQEGYTKNTIKGLIKIAKAQPDIETPIIAMNQQLAQMTQSIQQQSMAMQQVASLLASMKQSIDTQTQMQAQQMQMNQENSAQVQQQDPNAQQAQAQQDPNAQQAQPQPQPQQNDQATMQQVAALAQQLGQDPKGLIQQAQQQGMSMQDLLAQLQNYAAQAQQQPNAQQQDPNTQQQGQQPQQDPNAQGGDVTSTDVANSVAAQQMNGQQDPNAQGGDDGQGVPQTDDNGYMAQNITPEILETLKQLNDKKILESSIVSYLATLDTPVSVVKQYLENVKAGAVGLSKILMIIDFNYKKITNSVSETILINFLNKGKSIGRKLTDLIIEIEGL